MSAADVRIAAARGEAEARRQELAATLETIKLRLAPATIAQDAWQGAKDKSSEVAGTAVSAVKQRPGLAAGVAAGAALLLAHKSLISLVAGLFGDRRHDEHQEPEEQETEHG